MPLTLVRPATTRDVRAIAEVHVRSWLKAYRGLIPDAVLDGLSIEERERGWAQALRHPTSSEDRLWVADYQGRVVGFCATGPTRDEGEDPKRTAEVYAIYLAPESWNQGFGRELFQHAVHELRRQGFEAATLWVLEGNVRTRLFYKAAGWRRDGAVRGEPMTGEELPEVRYRKTLSEG